jgi:outer membrane protein TolC
MLIAGVLVGVSRTASVVWAQQPAPNLTFRFSMQQCVDYALNNNPDLVQAKYDALIARQSVNEQLSVGYPQLSASFDLRYYYQLPTTVIPAEAFGGPQGQFLEVAFGVPWNATAGVDFRQLLLDGSYFLGIQAAKLYEQLAVRKIGADEITVRANVMKAYYSNLVNQERIKIIKTNLQTLDTLLQQTRILYETGFAEQIDVMRLEVSRNNLVTEQENALRLVALSYNLLKFQMGMDQTHTLILTDEIDPDVLQSDLLATDVTLNPENRIEFELLGMQRKLQEYNTRRFKYASYPTVNLYGSLQTQALRTDFDVFNTSKRWFPIGLVGLQVNWLLFDGFGNRARGQQAYLNTLKIDAQITNLRNSVLLEYKNARTNLDNQLNTLNYQTRNVALAQEVYRVARIKLNAGVGSNLELVQAESDLKLAQTNYVNTLLDAYITRIDMLKAAGQLK